VLAVAVRMLIALVRAITRFGVTRMTGDERQLGSWIGLT
jgi:hypothetical protein